MRPFTRLNMQQFTDTQHRCWQQNAHTSKKSTKVPGLPSMYKLTCRVLLLATTRTGTLWIFRRGMRSYPVVLRGRSRHEFVSVRVRAARDENVFMTWMVCGTMVLCWSSQSDQCMTRYDDSKRDQEANQTTPCWPSRIPRPARACCRLPTQLRDTMNERANT